MCSEIELIGIHETYKTALLYGSYKSAALLYPLIYPNDKLNYENLIPEIIAEMHHRRKSSEQYMKQYHLTLTFLIEIGIKIKSSTSLIRLMNGINTENDYLLCAGNEYFYNIYDNLIELGVQMPRRKDISFIHTYGALLMIEKLNLMELFLNDDNIPHEIVVLCNSDYFNIWTLIIKYINLTEKDMACIFGYAMKCKVYMDNITFEKMICDFFVFFNAARFVLTDDILYTAMSCSYDALMYILSNVSDINVNNTYMIDVRKADTYHILKKYGIAVEWRETINQ